MKHLVAQDFLEDRARRYIAFQHSGTDGERVGRGFIRKMKKSKESLIGFFVHAQVVDAVPAGCQPVSLKAGIRVGSERTENLVAASTEHYTVTVLVDGVFQIKPAKEGIRRHFGCPHKVAAAVGFGLAEAQQFVRASLRVAPNPAMHRAEHLEYHGFLVRISQDLPSAFWIRHRADNNDCGKTVSPLCQGEVNAMSPFCNLPSRARSNIATFPDLLFCR